MFQMQEILKIYWQGVVVLLNEVFPVEPLKLNFFEMFLKKLQQLDCTLGGTYSTSSCKCLNIPKFIVSKVLNSDYG